MSFKAVKTEIEIEYDGKLNIATAKDRFAKNWRNRAVDWSALVGKLDNSLQTAETHAEYMKMSKSKQDTIKDIGGFVGGHLKEGKRRNGYVEDRQVVTLDVDFLSKGENITDNMLKAYDVAFAVYSTHKNCEKDPRQRLIIPLSRPVSPDEYEAIARKIADNIDIDLFDDSTYQPTRLMYWPSHSKDVEPYFYLNDTKWLEPDDVLDEYPNWQDVSYWPTSSRVDEAITRKCEKAEDPREKKGLIGKFCNVYSVTDAISTFLPDVYERVSDTRYTYVEGSTSSGLVIYEDGLYAYSNHSTDPAGNKLCNAFDLVRIHKFAGLDEEAKEDTPSTRLPSYKAMIEFARNDSAVKKYIYSEDFSEDIDDEDDWVSKLEVKKDGKILPSVDNACLILEHDKALSNIRTNILTGCIEAGDLPWRREFKYWQNTDSDQLYVWIARNKNVQFPDNVFSKALTEVANKRGFNPVKDYLEALPEWDGKKRVEKLLIDFLGAQDSPLTRESIAKVLLAAVTRMFEPGTKFDYMLVLNGPQGIGKSTFFSKLFVGFLSDALTMLDMRDKTGSEKLMGYWAIEVAEMAGMRKADIECVKSFISRTEDIYRPAYGRVVERHPRRCVIVGSTNSESGFLRDITGNRRFWPIKCSSGKRKPWNMTDEFIAQVWAEVMIMYKNKESLLLSPEAEAEALCAQREALEEDPRQAQVEIYLSRLLPKNWEKLDIDERLMFLGSDDEGEVERTTVSNAEIWVECFGKRLSDMERRDADSITALMMKIPGWQRTGKSKRINNYGKQKIYEKIDFNDF